MKIVFSVAKIEYVVYEFYRYKISNQWPINSANRNSSEIFFGNIFLLYINKVFRKPDIYESFHVKVILFRGCQNGDLRSRNETLHNHWLLSRIKIMIYKKLSKITCSENHVWLRKEGRTFILSSFYLLAAVNLWKMKMKLYHQQWSRYLPIWIFND